MSVEIKVPTLGESVTEATVGQWFKKVGDTVAADEPLVELETDKVTIEVPAPAAGTLEAIAAKEGETVNVGGLLGVVGSGAAATPRPAVVVPPSLGPAITAGQQTSALELNGQPGGAPPAASANGQIPPSPSAQKLMADSGLANGSVEGSGKHGQVLKEDVLAAIARPAASGASVLAAASAAPAAASLTASAAPVAVPQTRAAETLAVPPAPPVP
ncbi:MAG: E3 binding domain-containing protein, partial [Devosia sp.]|nr:E3 binding domain-containing protein [Devosia sp.]